jgi:hypothetical protein
MKLFVKGKRIIYKTLPFGNWREAKITFEIAFSDKRNLVENL